VGSRSSSNAGSQGPDSQDKEEEEEEEDEDVDLAQVLAYLLPRGMGSVMLQGLSDSDDDNDSIWEGQMGDRYNPPGTCLCAWAPAWGASRLQRCEAGSQDSWVLWEGRASPAFALWLIAIPSSPPPPPDQTIRLYDCRYGAFRKFRSIKARDVGWSVLDVAFTPDGAHLLYSSWSDYIHICNIYGDSDTHTVLDLRPDKRRFAVFSLTVSSDGREVLGGANDRCVYVFDREQNKRTLRIESHEDDVNAVAFADSSSHVLLSGGDDAICKVWDRRTMREDDPKPVGQLAGHQDGITFIDSKGDSRYLISNSKDQTIKLWDMRHFSGQEVLAASRQAVAQQNWDYRWQQVPKKGEKLAAAGGSLAGRHCVCVCVGGGPSGMAGLGLQPASLPGGCRTGRGEPPWGSPLGAALTPFPSPQWDKTLCLWEYRQAEYYKDDLRDPGPRATRRPRPRTPPRADDQAGRRELRYLLKPRAGGEGVG
uniref:DDB1 and CUL4 associated factor 11 n=1 Tax=Sphenodon punctatus TaxID=8508 RepID=A0A8D0HR11_SPHPU